MQTRLMVFVLSLSLLASCANPLNERTAYRYFGSGDRAFHAGNFRLAKEAYSRAIINARLGGLGAEAESDLLARLARTQGNLCEYDEAEKTFLEAIGVAEKLHGFGSPPTFPLKLELAQFSYDVARYVSAAKYFPMAFTVGQGLLDKDPIGFAILLDDFAVAQFRTGSSEGAEQTRERARQLRAKNQGAKALFIKAENYVPYPKTCR